MEPHPGRLVCLFCMTSESRQARTLTYHYENLRQAQSVSPRRLRSHKPVRSEHAISNDHEVS